jgi:hypothetical protein
VSDNKHTRFVIAVVTSTLQPTFSWGIRVSGLGDRTASRKYRVDRNAVGLCMDLDSALSSARAALLRSDRTEREQLALTAFVNPDDHDGDE